MSRRGLTIPELMLAMFLMFITAAFVMNLFILGARQTANVSQTSELVSYSNSKVSELLTAPFPSVGPSSGYFDPPANEYSFNVTTQPNFGSDPNLTVVEVEVRHTTHGTRNTRFLRSKLPPKDPGQAAFERLACWSCHSLPSMGYADAPGLVPLTGIGSRPAGWTGGLAPDAYVEQSVRDPALVDNYGGTYGAMQIYFEETDPLYDPVNNPANSVSDAEITALGNWLTSLP